jgi:glycosyltransferase involved in cell wall biosynthesis
MQSIQNQTFPDWELLVIDDNSTDDTEKLIRQFYHDKRIKLVKNKHSHSAAGARKTGYELAQGEYIAYLDSDNTAAPEWLATVLDRIDRYPGAKFVFPAHNTQVLLWKDKKFHMLRESCGFPTLPDEVSVWQHKFEGDPNGLVHISSARDLIEGWDENLRSYEDYDYALQLLIAYPNGILFVPQALINYTRLYGESGLCSESTYDDILKSLIYIDDKYKSNSHWQNLSTFNDKIADYTQLRNKGYSPLQRVIEKYGIR